MGRVLDPDLIVRARGGDESALRELVQATQNRLFRFCLVLCGDRVRAEDLTQETYLRALVKLESLDRPGAFVDWLFQIARNLHLDEMRRKPMLPLPETEEGHPGDAELLAVHETLSQFDADDRHLLMLVDMEGYTYAEAAGLMKISEDAVRSRLFRARQEFAKKWQDRATKPTRSTSSS